MPRALLPTRRVLQNLHVARAAVGVPRCGGRGAVHGGGARSGGGQYLGHRGDSPVRFTGDRGNDGGSVLGKSAPDCFPQLFHDCSEDLVVAVGLGEIERHEQNGLHVFGPTPKYGRAKPAATIANPKSRPSASPTVPSNRPAYLSQPWERTVTASPACSRVSANSCAALPSGVASSGALIPKQRHAIWKLMLKPKSSCNFIVSPSCRSTTVAGYGPKTVTTWACSAPRPRPRRQPAPPRESRATHRW